MTTALAMAEARPTVADFRRLPWLQKEVRRKGHGVSVSQLGSHRRGDEVIHEAAFLDVAASSKLFSSSRAGAMPIEAHLDLSWTIIG